jgi:N-acetylglucosaminyldiphosphoundecaprenol N-acetyl-beta-D-mannosaminyltransferase
MLQRSWRRVPLGGLAIDPLTEAEVVAYVRHALDRGDGGWIATPNVDILRLAAVDEAARALVADADLVVADGAPLVWASRLAGTPLPERVAGSDLTWSLARTLARDGRSVYLLGGEPARPAPTPSASRREGAHRAAAALTAVCPGLRIAGHASPRYGFDSRPAELSAVCAELVDAKPDVVYVGLGFPRQERLIARLRAELPTAWFLGCGAAINFVAGDIARARPWLRRAGLEWLDRLVREPGRLAERYLRHDVPFALRLLARAVFTRVSRRGWTRRVWSAGRHSLAPGARHR